MSPDRAPEPPAGRPIDVVDVDVSEVYDLRREVLRRGTPTDNVELDVDRDPGTRHLAVRDEQGHVVATSSWSVRECPDRAGVTAVQLRGMAVSDGEQRRGLGAALVDAGVDFATANGAALVWANARDSALSFYTANGFVVVGDGFITADTQIPHHRVVREI